MPKKFEREYELRFDMIEKGKTNSERFFVIKAKSLAELLSKFPLEIAIVMRNIKENEGWTDDEIPF